MVVSAVSRFEVRYLDLVSLIDRGEHEMAVEGEHCDGFGGSVSRVVFEDGSNYGMMSAFIRYRFLRIHLVFQNDIEGTVPAPVIECLMDAMNGSSCEHAHLWCSGYNANLVGGLRDQLPFQKDVYMSDELIYPRGQIDNRVNTSPLVAVPYSDSLLTDALELLECSFRNLSAPGSFTNNKDSFREKFPRTGKSRFEGFYLGEELVGLYYHNNAEIEYIAVSEKHQGRGFGTLVLKRALSTIVNDSERDPHLYCVSSNAGALSFYRRKGWRMAGKSVRLTMDLVNL